MYTRLTRDTEGNTARRGKGEIRGMIMRKIADIERGTSPEEEN
jgi:hypothetical protein